MGIIDAGYDLAVPRQWAGMNHLPLAVPHSQPEGKGEVRISITEHAESHRDATVFDLHMGSLHRRLVVDMQDIILKRSPEAKLYVRRMLEDAAMQLQRKYFAMWSSWPNEELGISWGICQKCGQATTGRYANGGAWECKDGCP